MTPMVQPMAGEAAEAPPPSAQQPQAPRLPRGCVTVFPNWCKGCDLCVEFCPAGVLELGAKGWVVVAHPEKCTACRWCELHCPDFAICVTERDPEQALCPHG